MVLDLWASNSFLLRWQTLTYLRVQMAMWTPGEVDMSCENQVDTQGTRHLSWRCAASIEYGHLTNANYSIEEISG